jgi:hypothetical protein
MKAYGSGCIDPHFLDLGTSWRWVVNFTPRPLYSQGKTSEPVWTIWRRGNYWLYRDSNSDTSVVQLVASRYTDYVIPAPYNLLNSSKYLISGSVAPQCRLRFVSSRGNHRFESDLAFADFLAEDTGYEGMHWNTACYVPLPAHSHSHSHWWYRHVSL